MRRSCFRAHNPRAYKPVSLQPYERKNRPSSDLLIMLGGSRCRPRIEPRLDRSSCSPPVDLCYTFQKVLTRPLVGLALVPFLVKVEHMIIAVCGGSLVISWKDPSNKLLLPCSQHHALDLVHEHGQHLRAISAKIPNP